MNATVWAELAVLAHEFRRKERVFSVGRGEDVAADSIARGLLWIVEPGRRSTRLVLSQPARDGEKSEKTESI